jgi:hypothetical protein
MFDEEMFNREFISDHEEIERIMKRVDNISNEIKKIRKTCASVVDEVKKVIDIIDKMKDCKISK